MAWEPDYITKDQFKNYRKIKDVADDAEIGFAISSASRAIDRYCSYRPNGVGAFRQFGKVDLSETRYYTPRWDQDLIRWVIEIDDLYSSAGLALEVDTGNDDVYGEVITNYVLRSRDAVQRNRPFTQIAISTRSTIQPTFFEDSAKVTSDKWGWSAVPTVIVQGTLITAHRIYKRRVAAYGNAGSQQKGTAVKENYDIDPDVVAMIPDDFIKLRWTA